MTDLFDTPAAVVTRDRWGRPLIKPIGGGKPVGYTRASTLGGTLEDQTNLTLWKQRITAVGVAGRPDLILAANAHRNDKNELNRVVEKAMEAAASGARASIGTGMHAYAEAVDRGRDPGYIPPEFAADLAAYRQLTEPLFEHVAIEQFCVCDELKVAGTPDRVSRLRRPLVAPNGANLPAGDVLITDEKTSGSMDFGGIKFSVQLAVYSRAAMYDPATGDRTPWPGPPRQDWGLIVWCPAGEGRAELYWVNLTAGWELARQSIDVRGQRRRKDLLVPANVDAASTPPTEYLELAFAAGTVAQLEQVWLDAVADGQTSPALLTACKNRKAALLAGAA